MAPAHAAVLNHVFADIEVTTITPPKDVHWERANQSTPKYPINLARAAIRGCAVIAIDIDENGEAKNVDIVKALPTTLGKATTNIVKHWQWKSLGNEVIPQQQIVRLDYCLGSSSEEKTKEQCQQQALAKCL